MIVWIPEVTHQQTGIKSRFPFETVTKQVRSAISQQQLGFLL